VIECIPWKPRSSELRVSGLGILKAYVGMYEWMVKNSFVEMSGIRLDRREESNAFTMIKSVVEWSFATLFPLDLPCLSRVCPLPFGLLSDELLLGLLLLMMETVRYRMICDVVLDYGIGGSLE
jgi:hypothetical protein